MNLHVQSITHAKRVAKSTQKLFADAGAPLPLARAQALTARWLGHRDWHELDRVARSGPLCTADQSLSGDALQKRIARQTTLAAECGVDYGLAANIVAEIAPSAAPKFIPEITWVPCAHGIAQAWPSH